MLQEVQQLVEFELELELVSSPASVASLDPLQAAATTIEPIALRSRPIPALYRQLDFEDTGHATTNSIVSARRAGVR